MWAICVESHGCRVGVTITVPLGVVLLEAADSWAHVTLANWINGCVSLCLP